MSIRYVRTTGKIQQDRVTEEMIETIRSLPFPLKEAVGALRVKIVTLKPKELPEKSWRALKDRGAMYRPENHTIYFTTSQPSWKTPDLCKEEAIHEFGHALDHRYGRKKGRRWESIPPSLWARGEPWQEYRELWKNRPPAPNPKEWYAVSFTQFLTTHLKYFRKKWRNKYPATYTFWDERLASLGLSCLF